MIFLTERAPDCTKFVIFHCDGSGCDMYRREGSKVFEADGEFYGKDFDDGHWLDAGYSAWMPIPDNFAFLRENAKGDQEGGSDAG